MYAEGCINQREGDVITTTQEEDFALYDNLIGKTENEVRVIELVFNERIDEFANMQSFYVDVNTLELIIVQQS